MKKIVSGADAIINLALKDANGTIINLYDENVVQSLNIVVYTKTTTEENKIVFNRISDLENNHLKLQSEDLDKLDRGQILLDVYIKFFCDEFSDGNFDYKTKVSTNIILI